MKTRPRLPRAARPVRVRARPSSALSLVAMVACAHACGAEDGAATTPGEERPGGATTNELLSGTNAFLPPADNITAERKPAFFSGNAFFNQAWTEAPSSNTARDGLGPLFNARSCSGCHFKDGRGRPPLTDAEGFTSMLLRLSVPGAGTNGEPAPEPSYGGQLQPFGVDGVPPEGAPFVRYQTLAGEYADGEAYALLEPTYGVAALALGAFGADVRVSPRVAPAMIGLGLLEAVPDERLLSLADPDDRDGDGISGRVNQVWDVEAQAVALGRFGWKAEQPSVRQQVAGAFLGDLGITSSLFPTQDCSPAQVECRNALGGGDPELSDLLLDRVQRYSQLLAVPARQAFADPDVLRGKATFTALGCNGCHTPSQRTRTDAELEELRDQSIWPYTDLLLHDMGEALSDGRPSFAAEGNEWRTPPLWGLGHYEVVSGHDRLLHDGRARGVAEAILWHAGEAQAAQAAFSALDGADRRDLVTFVESL